jgi:hypothetical protein
MGLRSLISFFDSLGPNKLPSVAALLFTALHCSAALYIRPQSTAKAHGGEYFQLMTVVHAKILINLAPNSFQITEPR